MSIFFYVQFLQIVIIQHDDLILYMMVKIFQIQYLQELNL